MTQDLIEDPVTTPVTALETRPATLESSAALGASLIAAAALAACGGGGGGGGGTPIANNPTPGTTVVLSSGTTSFPTASTDEQASRFLLQAQFSASDAEIASVKTLGFKTWLERQMAMPGPTGWDWLDNKGYGDVTNPANYYDNTYPADYMIWNQLMTAPDTLRKRVSLALSEFFVVSVNSLDISWRSHAIAHYWDTLNAHAFGNFRDLLEAITLNPAMGYFLNTRGNQRENSAGRQPDENYAREVMQLFSLGLNALNIDGTVQMSGGLPVPAYTESDVSNLARILTGYDIDMRQNVNSSVSGRNIPSTAYVRLPMRMIIARHSVLASTFLGTTIPQRASSTTGNATEEVAKAALKTALDTIFNHPNVGPFFCKQMIQRLVTSNPSPAYVARVATVFNSSGSGRRGDLAQVFAAILMDDEARGPSGLTSPEYGKLREPMVRLVQWARTFGVTSTNGGWQIPDQSQAGTNLGQSPLRSPSVFNFFRPGYAPASTTLTAGTVVPEFQLLNESSTGGYLNFIMSTISAGIGPGNPRDMRASYSAELALVLDATALVRRVSLLLSAGQVSAANQLAIVSALENTPLTAASSADAKLNRVRAAVLMVMACAQYLIQK